MPTLKLLTNLPIDGMKKILKIIEKKTRTCYNELAMYLLSDDNCDIVDTLKEKRRGDPEEIVRAVYKKWINGAGRQPAAWQILVGVLKEIELNSLTDEIEAALKLYAFDVMFSIPIKCTTLIGTPVARRMMVDVAVY